MMKFALDQGIYVELIEIQDRCFEYADALGVMRNEAIFQAQIRGLEWVFNVDNDVWPPADTLVKLLSRHLGTRANILVPYIVEQGTGMPLHGPARSPNSGFQWMKWSVLSMMLFKTCIFNRYGSEFWNTAIGADEGYHLQQLFRDGYYLGMDTDLQVATLRRPRYPLATNHLTDRERQETWHYINKKRLLTPDRRPVDPDDPRVDSAGNYNPFIDLSEQPKVDLAPDINVGSVGVGTAAGKDGTVIELR